MAKNDMEVIMYKILRYLYECMKLGVEPELEQFAWNSKLFDIPQSYWCKIIVTLVRKGYITGFAVIDKTKDAPMLQTDRPFEITFEGVQFLEENKKRPNVVTLPSGLQYEVINEGKVGTYAKATDQVKCHYEGTLIDGTLFDSSIKRGQPAVFGVNQVIPGWVEALQLMPEGAKWKLYIPSDLAYGAQGAGEMIPPHSTLIFEVELLEILSQK